MITPLLLAGLWSSISGFFGTMMVPLYAAVSGILVGAHALFSPLFGADSGVTWVLSIVSLTVFIRILLIPLFVKQINSSRNMQLIQPKMKALQEKHGADRERLGIETRKLMQEENVSMTASCLPLLLQMPIFLALFYVLSAVSRGQAKGYFFVHNPHLVESLSHANIFGAQLAGTFWPMSPFGATQILALVLILLMTAALFVTQLQLMGKNMPPEAKEGPMAQQQKMMLYLFPFMYLFSGVLIPIGVLVYWLTTNVWTLGQQFLLIHNNPTPNTPAYLEWEDRMIAKGKDPKKIAEERLAKRRRKRATTAPVATPQAGSSGVQRQVISNPDTIRRQQPTKQSRSQRKG